MTKKQSFSAALIMAIMMGVPACSSGAANAPKPISTPDQTSTAESVQAAADTSILLTEEANKVLEADAAATETQSALMVTETPVPENSLTPSPSSTPMPTPSPTPLSYLFPFSNTLPIQWEGYVGNTESIIQIEKIVANGFFSGYFLEPTLGNKYGINGKIVEEFDPFELGKWEQIEGYAPDLGGTWIRFTNYVVLEGDGPSDQLFLAHVNENGEMRGLFFWNKNTFEPFSSFELSLLDQ